MSVEVVDIFGNYLFNLDLPESTSMNVYQDEPVIVEEQQEATNSPAYLSELASRGIFVTLPRVVRVPQEEPFVFNPSIQDEVLDIGTDRLFDENERLKSLDNWTIPFIDKKSLAELGFYFLRDPDWVKCHFCGIELGDWSVFDVIMAEHKKWSPSCHFIRGFPTNNIPIDREHLEQIIPPNPGFTFYSSNTVSEGTIMSTNQETMDTDDEEEEDPKCKICRDEPINVVLLPCGHVLGFNCAEKVSTCPFCREKIRAIKKIFFS